MGVEEAFLVVGQTPLRHDGTTTAHDARHTLGRHGHEAKQHTGVDGEVIHPLLGLLDKGVAEELPRKVFGGPAHFFEGLIDGYRADGYGRIAENPFPGLVDVLARAEIHHRVGAPANGPHHFLHFFFDGAGNGRVTDIGINLHQEIAANNHGLDFGVIDVHGDDGTALGHFIADEFGRDLVLGRIGPKVHAGVLLAENGFRLFMLLIFPDGDIFHLRCDDSLAGIVHLSDTLSGLGTKGLAAPVETQVFQLGVIFALEPVFRCNTGKFFHITSVEDPLLPKGLQAFAHIAIIPSRFRGRQHDFAHGHLDGWVGTLHIDAPGSGERRPGNPGFFLALGEHFVLTGWD